MQGPYGRRDIPTLPGGNCAVERHFQERFTGDWVRRGSELHRGSPIGKERHVDHIGRPRREISDAETVGKGSEMLVGFECAADGGLEVRRVCTARRVIVRSVESIRAPHNVERTDRAAEGRRAGQVLIGAQAERSLRDREDPAEDGGRIGRAARRGPARMVVQRCQILAKVAGGHGHVHWRPEVDGGRSVCADDGQAVLD